MLRQYSLLTASLLALALLVISGCQNGKDQPSTAEVKSRNSPTDSSEHGHKPGTHGGNIVEIGRDNYHAEVVFEKDGVIRLYLLAQDEARVQEVELQTLTAYAKPAGSSESIRFDVKPAPTKEDTSGKTSQFTGTLPRVLWGKQVEVTVPSIRIASERFRFSFQSTAAMGHAAMPNKAGNAEAAKLYLTAGGKYTEADVKANGNMTAGQKYGDKLSSHDAKPRPGDKVCPITDTKANAEFTWVVGGKTYQFCCPPCIDEFVKTAKEKPDQIKNPGEYVKR
jgi:YHS domain-containing protein